jgi:hypothetical protein
VWVDNGILIPKHHFFQNPNTGTFFLETQQKNNELELLISSTK